MAYIPTVALVGRPNVGKSTLFNRLLGRRQALVEDVPGITRDRNYALVTRFGPHFTLVDTGGFEFADDDPLQQGMAQQARLAMEEADVVVCLLDAKQGLLPADWEMVEQLRGHQPVLYAVNKADNPRLELASSEFYALGVEPLLPVSAAHGQGMPAFEEQLLAELSRYGASEKARGREDIGVAVIGRPNVGKSSLVNRLLGYERVLVHNEAGTTRDSVDTRLSYNRQTYRLVDTAGIRRKGRVSQKIEKFSVMQALKAMGRAQVVLLVLDASEGITDQDLHVAGYAAEEGRAVVLVVNKWDLLAKDNATTGNWAKDLRHRFGFLPEAPIVFVSAHSGQRVQRLLPAVETLATEHGRRIATGPLNQVLAQATARHAPPMSRGRRLKFYYITQVGQHPPEFVVFVNQPEAVHFSYQRYLSNQLRQAFGFAGVPLKIHYRRRTRPQEKG